MSAPLAGVAVRDLAVGTAVPPLERTIDLPSMVAYAGATWDWHRLHYDAAYLAERALPAPVVDGQVFGALLVETLQDWLGPRARITKLAFRFKNLVFAGETVRCEGAVERVEGDTLTVDLRVVVPSPGGAPDKVAAAPCSATVVLAGSPRAAASPRTTDGARPGDQA